MDNHNALKGGSYGDQHGLHLAGGFVVSETTHRHGQNLPRHAHERASINFVLDGGYAETFRGSSHTYPPGWLVIKPAGEQHANHFRDASARCLLIELTNARHAAADACFAVHAPSARLHPELNPIALRIVRELRARDAFSALAIEAGILELLVSGGRRQQKSKAMATPRWLRPVLDRLHEAPANLSLTELAAEAGVHPTHLARVFRKRLGTTPAEYARQIRLNRAIERLTTSSEPIGTVAIQAGFFDQSHFSRLVKKHTGMTARELRRSRAR